VLRIVRAAAAIELRRFVLQHAEPTRPVRAPRGRRWAARAG
jgi:hypothetical protein